MGKLDFFLRNPGYVLYNLARPLLFWEFLSPLRVLLASSFVRFGSGVSLGPGVHLGEKNVSIGSRTTINPNVRIGADTRIGARAIVSEGCVINPAEHDLAQRERFFSRPVVVGDNVFFGANCIVLARAGSIGDNAVIGAGAVVTKPVPKNAVVAGNPAHVVRPLNP